MIGTKSQRMTSMSFFTHVGIEVLVVTADPMRQVDRIAVEETGPNLLQMMENGGRKILSWYEGDHSCANLPTWAGLIVSAREGGLHFDWEVSLA